MTTPVPAPQPQFPTETPNVVIRNPKVRDALYAVLAWVNLFAFIAVAVIAFTNNGVVPIWVLAIVLGLQLFSAGVGYTAKRNTP